MKQPETLDEAAARTHGCAGEAEELWMYQTEVIYTITVSTGQLAAERDEIARNVAIFRADQQVEVRGGGVSISKEAHVRKIGPA